MRVKVRYAGSRWNVQALYGRPGSGSLAVQVALEEAGAPYERIWVGREACGRWSAFVRSIQRAECRRCRCPTGPSCSSRLRCRSTSQTRRIRIPPGRRRPAPAGMRRFCSGWCFCLANVYEWRRCACTIPPADSARGEVDAEVIREKRQRWISQAHLAAHQPWAGSLCDGHRTTRSPMRYLYMLSKTGMVPGREIRVVCLRRRSWQHTQETHDGAPRQVARKVEADHAQ